MKKKVIILLLALVFLGSVSTLVLYNIGGYFLSSAFEVVNTEQPESAANTTEPSDGGMQRSAADLPDAEAQPLPAQSEPKESESPAAEPDPAGTTAPSAGEKNAPPDNTPAPVSENKTSGEEENGKKDAAEYTPTELEEISDSVSASDKLSASILVLSKLSAEDIQYLYALMEGGLTPEEKAEAKKLCFARFTDEEIEQIYDLYKKYSG